MAIVKVWDAPLRLWHWSFAACLVALLATGLADDLSLLPWHMRAGAVMAALLLFRLMWGLWGGRHARWPAYRVAPGDVAAHFRHGRAAGAHTAPGKALALAFVALASVQTAAGLLANDGAFTQGPLAHLVDGQTSDLAAWLHRRLFVAVLALIAIHLAAHAIYGLRGDRLPLAMITGRKSVAAASPRGPRPPADLRPAADRWWRALATAALAAAAVWAGGLWP